MTSRINFLLNFLLVILIVTIITACSKDKKTWEIARTKNDILSYEYYIKLYPFGKYIDSANLYINNIIENNDHLPKILIPPIAAWDNLIIDTICFQSTVSAPQSKEYAINSKTEYFNQAKEFFAKIGIAVVPNMINYRNKLSIKLKFNAIGANYENVGYQYTGYKVNGTILLSGEGETPIKLSVNEIEEAEEFINTIKDINDPFVKWRRDPGYAMPDLISTQFFADFIYKVWGSSPLIWLGNKYEIDERILEKKSKISKYDKSSIICACYSNDYKSCERALMIINSGDIKLEPKQILSLVSYNLNKYCLDYENPVISISDFLNAIDKMDASVMDAVPVLIKFIDERQKKGMFKNDKVEKKLEDITGQNFEGDINGWKDWWFYYG